MKVRQEQLEALERKRREDLAPRVALYLQQNFENARQVELRTLTRDSIDVVAQSHKHDLHTERQVALYAAAAWVFGRDFATRFPEANDILESPLPAESKAMALDDWAEATYLARVSGSEP